MPVAESRTSRDPAPSSTQVQGLSRRSEKSHPLLLEAAGCASGLHHRLRGRLSHLCVGQTRVQVQAVRLTGCKRGILQNRIYFIGSL